MIEITKTLEGNRLIAEFMGAEYERKKHLFEERFVESFIFKGHPGNWRVEKETNCYESPEQLMYHSDWDWIMPVIEKISNYHYPDYWKHGKDEDSGEYDDCAYLRTFGMRDKEGNYMVRINANSLFSSSKLIEATWLAVVDFIKYNKEN